MATINGIDRSAPITTAAEAEALASGGCAFVCRYYAAEGSKKQLLSAAETKLITGAGMRVVTVVQNVNGAAADFSPMEAERQANAALSCAEAALQPANTAIYFAVDYDASTVDMLTIEKYFQIINKALEGRYKIGVYGSGYVCNTLKAAGLVEYKWLAGSMGWAGYRTCTDWHIRQLADTSADVAQYADYGGWTVSEC